MSTIRQIEANRRNAQLSTGPRSVEGKAITRLNALKTGIDAQTQVIRGEDPAALEALTAEYFDRWHPTTPEARALVDTLVSNEWLLRRLRRVEAEYWDYRLVELKSVVPSNNHHMSGKVVHNGADTLTRLQRRIDSAERNYHRSLKELQRLQSNTTEIGSVPSNSIDADSEPPTVPAPPLVATPLAIIPAQTPPDTAIPSPPPPNSGPHEIESQA